MSRLTLFFLIAACLIAASSAAPTLRSNEIESQIHSTAHRLQELILQHIHRSKGFAALARLLKHIKLELPPPGCDSNLNATLDCATAQNWLNNITSVCPVSYIANGFADPLSVNISTVQDFCSGECVPKINQYLAQVVHSCWTNGNFDTNSVSQFSAALVSSQVGCLKDDQGNLCMSVSQNLSHVSGFLANGTLTAQQLNQTCSSSCVNKQYQMLTEFGQLQSLGTTGFYKLLCSQIDNSWCALVYQQVQSTNFSQSNSTSNSTAAPISTNGSSSSNSTSGDQQLTAWCQPCYRRFVQGAAKTLALSNGSPGTASFSLDNFTPTVNQLAYKCVRDQSGAFCVDKIVSDAAQNVSECGDVFDNIQGPITAACSPQCASQIQGHINQLGCCTMSIFQQRTNGSFSNGDNTLVPLIFNWIRNTCNLSIANSCSQQQFNFTVFVENVRQDWLNDTNNVQQVEVAMRTDLSARLAVPLSQVNITALQFYPVAQSNSNSSSGNATNSTTSGNSTNSTIGVVPNQNTSSVLCVNGTREVVQGMQAIGYLIPQSSQDLSWIQSEFSSAIAKDDLELADTASAVPYEARIDPLSPLALNQTGTNVTEVSNPWGGQNGTSV